MCVMFQLRHCAIWLSFTAVPCRLLSLVVAASLDSQQQMCLWCHILSLPVWQLVYTSTLSSLTAALLLVQQQHAVEALIRGENGFVA